MPEVDVRLERARQALAIAESADSKIAAYRIAAEEIAAYMEETGATQEFLARNLGASPGTISKILRWRRQGYPEGTTPFTMADGKLWRSMPCWIATAQARARLGLVNMSMRPSPVLLISSPPVASAAPRKMPKWASRRLSDASGPRRDEVPWNPRDQ